MGHMQVILRKQVPSLGNAGDVKDVANGYFRNYLFPRGFAHAATLAGLLEAERVRARVLQQQIQQKGVFLNVVEKLRQEHLVIVRKATEEGHLFGSVTARDIKEFLSSKGYELEERIIYLDAPLKELGTYPVLLRLDETTQDTISLAVERDTT